MNNLRVVTVPEAFSKKLWRGKSDFTIVGHNVEGKPLIRVYDELGQPTQALLSEVSVVRTLEEEAEILTAHSLRLAVIQQQYDLGNIDETGAKEILKGCLTPDDESSRFDDSDGLKVKP